MPLSVVLSLPTPATVAPCRKHHAADRSFFSTSTNAPSPAPPPKPRRANAPFLGRLRVGFVGGRALGKVITPRRRDRASTRGRRRAFIDWVPLAASLPSACRVLRLRYLRRRGRPTAGDVPPVAIACRYPWVGPAAVLSVFAPPQIRQSTVAASRPTQAD